MGEQSQCRAKTTFAAVAVEVKDLGGSALGVAGRHAADQLTPQAIEKAIIGIANSPEFLQALKKMAQRKSNEIYRVSARTANRNSVDLESLGKAAATAAKNHSRSVLESNSEFLKLKRDAQKIKNNISCTPTGIWYSENKDKTGFIILSVIGFTAIGGAVTYFMRQDKKVDALVSPLLENLEKSGTAPLIGEYKIKLKKFSLYDGNAEVRLLLSHEFKSVRVDLSLANKFNFERGKSFKYALSVADLAVRYKVSDDSAVTARYNERQGRNGQNIQTFSLEGNVKLNGNTSLNFGISDDSQNGSSAMINLRISF